MAAGAASQRTYQTVGRASYVIGDERTACESAINLERPLEAGTPRSR